MSTNKTNDGYIPSCMTNGWYEMRIAELESLVRDIWTFYHMPTPYMPKEIAIRMTVEESLIERVAALGLSGGDAE